ncbi:helix-turn-helix transcriptional regulator [Paludicola sp. MB14-C6]|uniref:helix-turn-helix transcriptional regulator n=1 Tax=Paludihabitans sp. MB14-C6 TaxID=3070656 RepID=UPI0027DB318F|nr:helix-turn-helix transcriptional regulator [Paludicola sp. MB14-C6]WMJ24121.1 helix-turn-helix transcriptional regulator [Paludicola sp. MB14-C6]
MKNRIKELRLQKKMKQSELASLIGISASAIGMYEQERRDPDPETLLRIAQIFDVSVDYLICANDMVSSFDVDSMAKGITQNLMDNPALMFSADCYTAQELADLSNIIEDSVKTALLKKLKPHLKSAE